MNTEIKCQGQQCIISIFINTCVILNNLLRYGEQGTGLIYCSYIVQYRTLIVQYRALMGQYANFTVSYITGLLTDLNWE